MMKLIDHHQCDQTVRLILPICGLYRQWAKNDAKLNKGTNFDGSLYFAIVVCCQRPKT